MEKEHRERAYLIGLKGGQVAVIAQELQGNKTIDQVDALNRSHRQPGKRRDQGERFVDWFEAR